MLKTLFPPGIPKTKRGFDLLIACFGLVVLSPVYLFIALIIRINLGNPILFHQQRPGYQGKPFKLIKFRTMTDQRNSDNRHLSDAERMTRLGRILRATSLDEIPELINILRGEMSLVGPRPLLMQYLDRYSPEQARRHLVLPGLTGWAQVNGRNELNWEEKFQLDVWYVDNWSFFLDVKILWLTAWMVIKREGINQDGQATVEEFKGTTADKQSP